MFNWFLKHKNTSGVISIMLSLLLLPVYSLGALLLEASRMKNAQQELDELNFMGTMSVMAGYLDYMQERFGILGYESESDDNTPDFSETTFRQYIMYCEEKGGVDTKALNRIFGIDEDQCSVEYMYSLADTKVLKNQIMQYGKYTIPITIIKDLTLTDFLSDLKDKLSNFGKNCERLKGYSSTVSKVAKLSDKYDELIKKIDEYNNSKNDSNQKRNAFKSSLMTVINEFPKDSKYGDVDLKASINLTNCNLNTIKTRKTTLEEDKKELDDNISKMELTADEKFDDGADKNKKYDFNTLYTKINSDFGFNETDVKKLYYEKSDRDTTSTKMAHTISYLSDLTDYIEKYGKNLENDWNTYKSTLDDVESKYSAYDSAMREYMKTIEEVAASLESATDAALGTTTGNNAELLKTLNEIRLDWQTKKGEQTKGLQKLKDMVIYKNSVSSVNSKQYKVYFTSGSQVDIDKWDVLTKLPEIKNDVSDKGGIFNYEERDIKDSVKAFSEDLEGEALTGFETFLSQFKLMMELFSTFVSAGMPANPLLCNDMSEYQTTLPSCSYVETADKNSSSEDEKKANDKVNEISKSTEEQNYKTDDMTTQDPEGFTNKCKNHFERICQGFDKINESKEGAEENLKEIYDAVSNLSIFTVFKICKAIAGLVGDLITFIQGLIDVCFGFVDIIKEGLEVILKFLWEKIVIAGYCAKQFPNRATFFDKDARDLAGNKFLSCTDETKKYMFFGAQLEYLANGNKNTNMSELANQAAAYTRLFAMRCFLNIIAVYQNNFVSLCANTASLVPVAGPVLYYVVYVGFDLLESYVDMVSLVVGCKVPLLKLDPNEGLTCVNMILWNKQKSDTKTEEQLNKMSEEERNKYYEDQKIIDRDKKAYDNIIFVDDPVAQQQGLKKYLDSRNSTGNKEIVNQVNKLNDTFKNIGKLDKDKNKYQVLDMEKNSVQEAYKSMKSFLEMYICSKSYLKVSYGGHLGILLCIFYSTDDLVKRAGDLMQMEYWNKKDSTKFRMENCYTYMKTDVEANYQSLLPIISMGKKDLSIFKYHSSKYSGY